MTRKLTLRWPSRAALERDFEADLRHGRAFVKSAAGYDRLSQVELVLVHPDDRSELCLAATVVVDQEGVGVAIDDFDDDTAGEIRAFIDAGEKTDAGRPMSLHARLRELNLMQQQKLARNGELQERVALERLFGKNVWEPLLANPKLTIPEVARIARKGTVPRPLLEQIADNAQWIRAAPIRRALLSNPRLGPDAALKVLRATPPRELKLMEHQMGYPLAVRQAAARLLGRG